MVWVGRDLNNHLIPAFLLEPPAFLCPHLQTAQSCQWVRMRALGLSGDPQRAGARLVFWECQKMRRKAGDRASLGQQCHLGSTETLQAGLDAVARADPADVVSALLLLLGGVGE